MHKHVIVLVITLLLGACGFHPRGVTEVPENARLMFVEAPNTLRDELVVYLLDGGAEISPKRDTAEVVLEVKNTNFERRTLSVDPDTGKEREFELTYKVTFLARMQDGTWLLRPQTVTLLRDYVFDQDNLLGKSREQGTLRDEMRRDAAQQILVRLSSAFDG